MFKSVLVFGIIAAFLNITMAISAEHQAHIQAKLVKVGFECIKDHPVSIDDLTSFKQKLFPDSENAGCFIGCIFNKIGLFDDKGTLSHTTAFEAAKEIFKDEEQLNNVGEFLTTCAKVNDEKVADGEKGCDRAKLAFNCYADNYKKFDFDLSF